MSRRWIEGFESGIITAAPYWDKSSALTVSTTTVRSGSCSMRVDAEEWNNGLPLPSLEVWDDDVGDYLLPTNIYARTAVWGDSTQTAPNPTILAVGLEWGGVRIELIREDATGHLQLKMADTVLATSSVGMSLGQWVVMELGVVVGASATIEARMDGATVVSWSGSLTPDPFGIYQVVVGGGGYASPDSYFLGYYDDIAVDDAMWCGHNGRVVYLPVTTNAGSQQWTPLSGASNAAMVDESFTDLDDTVIYVMSDEDVPPALTLTDTYECMNIGEVESITCVAPFIVGKVVDPGPPYDVWAALAIQSGSTTTEYAVSSSGYSTQYRSDISVIEQADPATSSGWTPDKVNALRLKLQTAIIGHGA